MKANCISCQEMVPVGAAPHIGTLVKCPKCDAQLEVIWLDPLELDWPTEDYVDDYENDYEGEFDGQ